MARQVAGVTWSAAPEAGRGVTARKVVAVLAVVLAGQALFALCLPLISRSTAACPGRIPPHQGGGIRPGTRWTSA